MSIQRFISDNIELRVLRTLTIAFHILWCVPLSCILSLLITPLALEACPCHGVKSTSPFRYRDGHLYLWYFSVSESEALINSRTRVLLVLYLQIWLAMHQIRGKVVWFEMIKCVHVHTFTKSCSCSSSHTVLRRVGYHASCLSKERTRKIWLTLSSLISVPFNSLFAVGQRK